MADRTETASDFAGLKLRGGMPKDNGLSPLAPALVTDTSRIVYFVAAAKVADVIHHVDNNTETAVLKLIGIEGDLTDDEVHALRLVLDRARVRRTGEQPLFDSAGEPEDAAKVVGGGDVDEAAAAEQDRHLSSVT